MQFGFTLKPEHSIAETLELAGLGESLGFDYLWLFDSHVLWREPYALLTLIAEHTERLRLGTCVTNPGTREPSVTASALATLDEVSDGRMDLGIGRGDSARRVLGKPPITLANTEEAIKVIRDLVEGRTVTYEGTELQLTWTGKWRLPVWVAGYGPMALAMTGRVADGVILQLADPDLIRWFAGQVREAAAAAGRDPASIKVQAAAPLHLGPRSVGRERTRWFPALVSNHVVDLVNKYPREQLPESLTGYVSDRTGYDYHHHAEVGSSNAGFVGDEVTDRFCVLGEVDEVLDKLRVLGDAGVDQFNVYLMNGDERDQLERIGRRDHPRPRRREDGLAARRPIRVASNRPTTADRRRRSRRRYAWTRRPRHRRSRSRPRPRPRSSRRRGPNRPRCHQFRPAGTIGATPRPKVILSLELHRTDTGDPSPVPRSAPVEAIHAEHPGPAPT